VIEELLQCRCGHGISGHSGSGCEGDRMRPCGCARSRADVLAMAIDDVRADAAPAAAGTLPFAPRVVTT
jgi:hypothetical protein